MKEFFGRDWSCEECEWVALQVIDVKYHRKEGMLYRSKFWDYKMLHPIQATLLFAEHYKDALKMAISKQHDYYAGRNYKGLKRDNLLECGARVITGMHKARQVSDEYGIPYNFWCYRAMDYAMTVKLPHLPQPNMLYSRNPKGFEKISMVDSIVRDWASVQRDQVFLSRESFYTIDNYCSNRYQLEHQRYLINRIRASNAKPAMIAKYALEERLIFPELIQKEFGQSMLNQAKKFVSEM